MQPHGFRPPVFGFPMAFHPPNFVPQLPLRPHVVALPPPPLIPPRYQQPQPQPQPPQQQQQPAANAIMGPLEPGLKYTYDAATDSWRKEEIIVRISTKPFDEGGMRYCFKVHEMQGDDGLQSFTPCVGKIFKFPEKSKSYFDEAMTQMVAESYAQEFNKNPAAINKVAFLPVSVLKLPQRKEVMTIEPELSGRYVKHNDNNGHVATDRYTPQAFSHFTLASSGQELLVCDIQGVGDFYTDPQIHSVSANFGLGNFGREGIRQFIRTHRCNDVCKAMGLRPL